MDNTLEDSYTIAYTRFLLDVSIVGDILDHHVAIAPCLFGYVEFGQKYMNDPATKKGKKNIQEMGYSFK
jgi:thiaminase